MNLLRKRVAATDEKLKALKEARKASDKDRRQAYKQTKADCEPAPDSSGATEPELSPFHGDYTNVASGRTHPHRSARPL
jgi:hypothetical protein